MKCGMFFPEMVLSVDAYAQHRVNTLPQHERTSNDVTFNFVTSMDVKAVREVSLMSGSALCLNGQADKGPGQKGGRLSLYYNGK